MKYPQIKWREIRKKNPKTYNFIPKEEYAKNGTFFITCLSISLTETVTYCAKTGKKLAKAVASLSPSGLTSSSARIEAYFINNYQETGEFPYTKEEREALASVQHLINKRTI